MKAQQPSEPGDSWRGTFSLLVKAERVVESVQTEQHRDCAHRYLLLLEKVLHRGPAYPGISYVRAMHVHTLIEKLLRMEVVL